MKQSKSSPHWANLLFHLYLLPLPCQYSSRLHRTSCPPVVARPILIGVIRYAPGPAHVSTLIADAGLSGCTTAMDSALFTATWTNVKEGLKNRKSRESFVCRG